jgi:hypothetical protein
VDNSLVIVLILSAIGMSLLFLSLVLFYGIISLLTAATRERSAASAGRTTGAKAQADEPTDQALRAAAVAIALARAKAKGQTARAGSSVTVASGGRELTPWWSLHHQRRLAEKGKSRRP